MRQVPPAKSPSAGLHRLSTAVLLVALVAVAPITAETPKDDVLEEVRAMLEAGLSEPIILQWLDAGERRPRHPTAVELIDLQQAGASDELLARLLDLAGEAAGAGAEDAVADPRVAAAAGKVPVTFELSYLPDFAEDEDEWDLYVYIDGEPLTFVPAGSLLSARPLRFRQYLPPGRHVLRVTQERHVRRGPERWFHAARMADVELPLELTGTRAEVELKFRQPQFAFGRSDGPLSFRLVQGKEVEVLEKQGGDPEDWTPVCEDVEANARDGRLEKSLRRQLEDCGRWSELWDELEVPSRDEVRQALALFRYRPVPKDQPLD